MPFLLILLAYGCRAKPFLALPYVALSCPGMPFPGLMRVFHSVLPFGHALPLFCPFLSSTLLCLLCSPSCPALAMPIAHHPILCYVIESVLLSFPPYQLFCVY